MNDKQFQQLEDCLYDTFCVLQCIEDKLEKLIKIQENGQKGNATNGGRAETV